MPKPSRNVAAAGVTVCPVNYSSLLIPHVFPEERDLITLLNVLDPRRKVDIMLNQQGLAFSEADDKPLVSRAMSIIRQDARNGAFAFNLDIAFSTFPRLGYSRVRRHTGSGLSTRARHCGDCQDADKK
jgi:hypothetical protein